MKTNYKILFAVLFVFIAFLGMYLFSFYKSVTDTEDVKLNGYIYDEKTKQPIPNTLIMIISERYEDDSGNTNYDEYLGKDTIKLYSDSKGYYSTIIEKTALISLYFKKEGYVQKKIEGEYPAKQMNYKVYLKKE
jgi:hypothetical protein